MVIFLYFQTIVALLSPSHRKGQDIKWGLVGYSTVMFGLVTTFTAMNVRLQQLSYIDNREFPGVTNALPPGPIGWSLFMYSKPLVIVPNACFIIANWMADGLLVSINAHSVRGRADKKQLDVSLLRHLQHATLGFDFPPYALLGLDL